MYEVRSGKARRSDRSGENLWSVVLAGGEGERMRSLIEPWLGRHRPKQYCTFVGTRSMLQHTLDRSAAVAPPSRTVTVIGHGHGRWLAESTRAGQAGLVLEQPAALGTAVGVMLAVAHVIERDPDAILLVFPADHLVHPETTFVRHVLSACGHARRLRDKILLLGALPDRASTDLGWILPAGGRNGRRSGPLAVRAFQEKPASQQAQELARSGALWNTMVLAVRAATLWDLARRHLPEVAQRFETLRQTLHAVRRGRADAAFEMLALASIYRGMPTADLSRDLLERCPDSLRVLPLEGVEWSDWGRPERIAETLDRLEMTRRLSPGLVLPGLGGASRGAFAAASAESN